MTKPFDKPDFLCIGAQKSATTWLNNILRTFPEVFLPPFKEVHYFTHANQPVPQRLIRYRLNHFHGTYQKIMQSQRPSLPMLEWIARLCFASKQDDDWYQLIFENFKDYFCGDITPSYSTLSKDEVAYVHERLPNAKIIFMMRDPIPRTWSNVSQNMNMGITSKTQSLADLIQQVDSDAVNFRSDYVRTINNWREFYSSEQFHYVYFDNVKSQPLSVLQGICQFLNIPYHADLAQQQAGTPVNVSSNKSDIPSELEAYIAQKYIPMLEELKELVPESGIIDKWLDNAQSKVAGR